MSGNRVLVLDDDDSIARDIQQRLEKLGYTVCEVAHSGETLGTNPRDSFLSNCGFPFCIRRCTPIRSHFNP